MGKDQKNINSAIADRSSSLPSMWFWLVLGLTYYFVLVFYRWPESYCSIILVYEKLCATVWPLADRRM